MNNKEKKKHLIRDAIIIAVSILIAVTIVEKDILGGLLAAAQGLKLAGSFLAGMFFISIFTVAPAGVILFEIAKANPVLEVAFFGALGSLAGDFIIFHFIKDSLTNDIFYLIKKTKLQRLMGIFHLNLFRWLVPCLGALIVASPLPDELGLAMMGLSKVKTSTFILISFTLNFLGILAICLVAKSV